MNYTDAQWRSIIMCPTCRKRLRQGNRRPCVKCIERENKHERKNNKAA